MSMQLYNEKKEGVLDPSTARWHVPQVQGLIRFVVVKRLPTTNLKKETDDIKSFIEGPLGLEFRKWVSSTKPPVSSRFLGEGRFARYEIYQVATAKKSNAIPQELRFVALGDKDWYVFALLLTPTDSENFYVWAVNTFDFDMMVKDFR